MSIDMGVARGELELDFTNFQTACKTAVRELENVDRQGELLRSEFKELTSSSSSLADQLKGMEKSTKLWSNEIKIANDKAKIYSESIKGLNGYISECESKQKNLKSEIEKVQAQYDRSCEKVEKLAAGVGKESEEYKKAVAQSEKYRTEQLNLESQYEELGIEIVNCRNKTTEYQTALNNTQVQVQEMSEELYLMESSLNRVGTVMDTAGTKMKNFGDKLSDIGGKMSLYISTPVASLGVGAFKAAEDFETAFTGVTKTVDGTAGEILELRQGIIDMAKELPASTTEISAVAEAAGQLGIQVPNILGFTRTMIDLGNSTNLSAEEGATALARFANVTEMSQEDFDRLGSTIVDLGNKFATTESEIVEMGSRLVGAGHQVGMTEPEIMGFAAALSSVGIEAEAGGTAFSTLMSRMQLAVVEGGESLDQFASVAGMSAAEFKNAFEQDAAGAIVSFIQGLSTCEDRGQSAIQVLTDMELSDVRLRDAILRTAGASDMFTSAVETGTAAWEENTALTDEASRFYDTTANKIKVAKNQITDAARVMGENMLPVVADLAEDLSDLTEKFADLPPETQKGIIKFGALVAAAGPVTKVTGTLASGIGSVTKGFGSMAKKLSEKRAFDVAKKSLSGVEAIAQELGTTTTETGNVFTGFGSMLTKFAGPAGGAALAVGAIAGIGIGLWKLYDDMVEADIAEHFGDIELAAEEVEDVAERLTTTDWTIRLNTYMDAKEKLGTYQENIQSAIAEINKTEWKVSVGLELTEEEKQSYKESISSYVQNCQKYVEEQGYVVNLAISAGFDPGSPTGESLAAFANEYYANASTELTKLGLELSDLVNESFVNGTFDENRLEIEELKKKIADTVNEVTASALDAKYEGTISDFRVTIGNIDMGDLTEESFNQVNEKIGEYTQQLQEYADENKQDVMLAITAQYSANIKEGMSEETARQIMEDSIQELELNLSQQKGEVIVQGIDFSFDALKENFGYRISDAKADLDEDFEEIKDYFLENFDAVSPKQLMMTSMSHNAWIGNDQAVRRSVKEALSALEPQKADLEKIADSYLEAGKAVPQNIVKGLTDIYEMSALAGETDDLYKLWAKEIADSPERMEALAEAKKSGREIPEGVIEAVSMYSGKIYNAITGMWEEPVQATREHIQPILDYLNKSGLDCGNEAAKGLAASYGLIYDATTKTWIAVSDATLDSEPNIKSVVEQCGLTVTDALIDSIQEQNEPTKQQMLTLLQQLVTATDEQREPILLKLAELGVDVSSSLAEGMMSNYSFVQSSTSGMVDVIDKTSGEKIATLKQPMADRLLDVIGGAIEYTNSHITQSGPQLYPPEIKEFDPTKLDSWADKTMWALQRSLEGHGTLTVPVKTIASPGDRPIAGHSNGGFTDHEQLSWLSEGNKPEVVIPLSADKRQRALSLYEQTGQELGIIPVEDPATLAMRRQIVRELGYTPPQIYDTSALFRHTPEIDYNKLGKVIADELRKAPVQVDVPISVQEGGVYLDNELVGRQQAPVISRIQAKNI